MDQRPCIMIEIDSAEEISDRKIRVVLKDTKEAVCLPKNQVGYLPGAILVTEWWAKKMRQRKKGTG